MFQTLLLFVVVLGAINILRMALYFLGSDVYNLRHHWLNKKSSQDQSSPPLFSVVIPAYNEEKTIIKCIESVFGGNYPKKLLQVIVVDDGSTDKTGDYVKQLQTKDPSANLVLIKQNRGGKASALNYALKHHVQGNMAMCLDADSSLAPEAIMNTLKYFLNDPRLTALAANVKIRENGTFLSFIQKFEYIVSYQMKRAHTAYNIEYIIGGIGSTFRLSELNKINFYDTNTLTEDIDLTMKIISRGNKDARVAYAADVVAYTEPVESIAALIRQRFRWKYGRYQTFLKNKQMFFNRQKEFGKLLTFFQLPYALASDALFLFEPAVLFVILSVVFVLGDFWTFIVALCVMTLYLSLNILKENTISPKKQILLIVSTPLVYFLFYVLSYVEYVALIKSLLKVHKLPQSIKKGDNTWTPVERVINRR